MYSSGDMGVFAFLLFTRHGRDSILLPRQPRSELEPRSQGGSMALSLILVKRSWRSPSLCYVEWLVNSEAVSRLGHVTGSCDLRDSEIVV